MEENNSNFCVKCDEKLEGNQGHKVLKCNGKCNKVMHYTCSSYNQNELQFLESNKDNVKWFCDRCSRDGGVKAQ